jgi:hypothetical protein
MSQNQEALDEIVQIARSHGLTLQDIEMSMQASSVQKKEASSNKAATIFGYIGGILVLSGVSIFIFINMQWEQLGPLGRVLITLIPGLFAFGMAVYCTFDERIEKGATPLFLLAAAIEPTGILIALKEFAHGHNPHHGILFMCLIMLAQQGLVFLARQRTVLAFTSILFFLAFLMTAVDMFHIFPRHTGLLVGGSELCLAYALSGSPHRSIAPVNYFFGSVFFLSALGTCLYDTPFELLFLGATCLFIYGSVLARSRVLLSVSAVLMLAYIGRFSEKYFAHTLGWPITLIVGGGFMIALGVLVIKLNIKYMAPSAK